METGSSTYQIFGGFFFFFLAAAFMEALSSGLAPESITLLGCLFISGHTQMSIRPPQSMYLE